MRSQIAVTLLFLFLGMCFPGAVSAQISYPPLPNAAKNNLVKVAAETAELFVRRGVLYRDDDIQEILDRVGESIFPAVQEDYINFRIFLIRDPSPIIFSLAGGQIYVHTGLLARLDSEAQLAAVIAHEAHHVAAHHHILANNSRRRKANIAGAIAMGLNNRQSGSPFPDAYHTGTSYESNMGHITKTKFPDKFEIEADAMSIGLIGQAGHPPTAALQTIARIRQDPELSVPSPLGSFTSIEALSERQGYLQELVDGLPVRSASAALADNRPLILRRVIEMTIDDYIRLDRPHTAVRLIDSMIAYQPDAFLYAAKGDSHMGMGPRPTFKELETKKWGIFTYKANLTREEVDAQYLETEQGQARLAENLESAVTAYNTAIEMDPGNARAYRGLGDFHFAKIDLRKAGRNYIKYLKLAPEALDRPTVLGRLQQIKAKLQKQKEAT